MNTPQTAFAARSDNDPNGYAYTDENSCDPAFRRDVLACFDSSRRAIPARWLYDMAGSQLFEDITGIPEYYPTRIETALLKKYGGEIAGKAGPAAAVIEFGSGSSVKTPHLLRAMKPDIYVPIDISGDFLRESAAALHEQFPDMQIMPVEADFMGKITLPDAVRDCAKFGFFPGSTIGNMIARTSTDLLRHMRDTLGENAKLLIGMDRIKSEDVLVPAYDDAAGVTAAFNLNLLSRINRELNGSIPVDKFRHVARWNDYYARIEMHLQAREDIDFEVDGQSFHMDRDETIHTENSHKYGPRDARLLLRAGGWSPMAEWTDEKEYFALILAEARPAKNAP